MRMKIEDVVKTEDGLVAISSESPFYPDGKGGQLGDRGRIGDAEVVRVYEKDGKIFHVLKDALDPGEYEVWIDEDRRKEIARHHTAQHILSASFMKIANMKTLSFHMGEDFSTIDLDVHPISEDILKKVEDLANDVIMENRSVIEHIVEREEALKLPLRKPLSDKVKGRVRIIEVEDFDLSACAGFHVRRTGEIGMVKILNHEKVKGSLTRVHFVAGKRALEEYRKRVDVLNRLSKKLTTSIDEMEMRIDIILEDFKNLKGDFEKISEEYARFLFKKLKERAERIGNIEVIYYDGFKSVGDALLKILERSNDVDNILLIVKTGGSYQMASQSLEVGKLIKELLPKVKGRGGGGKKIGRIIADVDHHGLIDALRETIEK